MKRVLGLAIVLVLAVAVFSVLPAAAQAGAGTSPATFTVLVGAEFGIQQTEMGPAGAWQVMSYYPGTITINAGDTVVWKANSAEPHTVTLPALGGSMPPFIIGDAGGPKLNAQVILPQGGASYNGSAFVGSGQMGKGPQSATEYRLTFTKPGTYTYYCGFHNMMKGTVIVQAAGSAGRDTQAAINQRAKAELATAHTLVAQSESKVRPQPAPSSGPGTTRTYNVLIGWGDSTLSYMRFIPGDLKIHAGDTVVWSQGDVDAPHTVTFVPAGQPVPEFVLPDLHLNMAALAPAGGPVYSGSGFFNSGLLNGTQGPQPHSYTLTFAKPGVYQYVCILHDEMGMVGTITVLPARGPAS